MEIMGMVERGMGMSGQMGFPTANIRCDLPKGLYVGQTEFGGAVMAVGNGFAEVHIIGMSGDIYGMNLDVKGVVRIPDELVKNFMKTCFGDGHVNNH